ncbi:MAG: hypothetical protein WCP57_10470 [Bacteroidota bacterium]
MPIEWIALVKELPSLIKDLGGLITSSRATKNLLLSELKNNLKQFENAKKAPLSYDQLITILSNEQMLVARKSGFAFSLIKIGRIQEKHIIDKRNKRYIGKDCEWLFISISDKIDELKKIQSQKSLNEIDKLNIPLQFSNLFFKMKLLAEFIR